MPAVSLGLVSDESSEPPAFVRRFIADPPWLPLTGMVQPGDRPTDRIALEPGLSDEEFDDVKSSFKFVFPPDLRALLAAALPVSPRFPDWRSALDEDLETALDWPAEGICFDVERNGFWLEAWGVRPLDSDEAGAIARERIAEAPTLIPIYGHRYIPDQPAGAGNPVLSVYQSDISYYGRDLPAYLDREFRPSRGRAPIADARHVPFWSDLIS
jgi:hypothetical protein